jgi:hypothetical protein
MIFIMIEISHIYDFYHDRNQIPTQRSLLNLLVFSDEKYRFFTPALSII